MDRPLRLKYILFFLVGMFLSVTSLEAQPPWDPNWFTCTGTSVSQCQSTIPSYFVDLSSTPDAKWYSCSVQRGPKGHTCCGFPPAHQNDQCIEFKVLVHPSTQAIIFRIPEAQETEWQQDKQHPNAPGSPGAKPSINTYRVNCGPLTGGQKGNVPTCLTQAQLQDTIFITYCQTGNNNNVYSIKTVSGQISSGDLIVQEGECGGDVHVSPTNIDINTISWSSTQNPSYESYLSSLTDTIVTVLVPNGADLSDADWVNGIPYLEYEVCGYPTGWDQCNGIDSVCGIARIAVVKPPSITANDTTVCPEEPFFVAVDHANPGIFDYWWYDGPGGTGTLVASGNGVWSHTFNSVGTKSVVFVDPTVAVLGLDPNCTRDTVNFVIDTFPTPEAEISDPGLICTNIVDGSVDYQFSTPAVTGASYYWEFFESPPGGSPFETSTSRTPTVEFSTCGDKLVYLTVTSEDNCLNHDTLLVHADSLAPDLSGCNLPNPTLECGGTAANNQAITDWHNDNLDILEDANGCVNEDCPWEVTSDFDLDNFDNTTGCGPGSNTGSITVLYTVSDGCFSTDISATFTIVDNTPPSVDDPDLDDMNFECVLEVPDPESDINLVEVCGTASFNHLGDSPAGDPCNGFQIVRTYELIDACNNRDTFYQTFTLSDNTDPTISCGGQIDIEGCGIGDVQGSVVFGLEYSPTKRLITLAELQAIGGDADDNCGIDSLYYIDVQSGACPITITRTYSVVDSCDNIDQCTQIITVDDTELPQINAPGDINDEACVIDDIAGISDLPYSADSVTIDYNTFINLRSDVGSPSASDNCQMDFIKYIDTYTTDACQYVVTRTFVVQDTCGNRAWDVQTITVSDQTDPTITCPGPITVDGCNTTDIDAATGLPYSSTLATIDSATFVNLNTSGGITPAVNDNCGIESITYQDADLTPLCPAVVSIERTFIVTDSCGLTASCTQLINLEDNTDPTFICPPDTTVDCQESTEINNTGEPTDVNDNCVTPDVTYDDVIIPGSCDFNYTIERTWIFTDQCNTTTCLQIINVQDTTNPVVDCSGLTDLVLECDQDYEGEIQTWLQNMMDILDQDSDDNCGDIAITHNYDTLPNLSCALDAPAVITFTLTDDCGNFSTCTANIFIDDTTPPDVNCVQQDLVMDCGDDYVTEIQNWIDATMADLLNNTTDDCGDTIIVSHDWDSIPPSYSCAGSTSITVTFTVEDRCGNSVACDADVSIQDTIPPTVDCSLVAAGGTHACWNDLIAQIQLDSTLFTDAIFGIVYDNNCHDAYTVSISGIPDPTNCPTPNIVVTYTVTDPCGNFTDCDVTYALDNPGPSITCPTAAPYQCYIDLEAEVYADSLELTTSGVPVSCGMPWTVEVLDIPTITTCPSDVTVEFVVMDSCGRTDTCSVNYTFVEEAPVITCPSDEVFDGCSTDDLASLTPWPYSAIPALITEAEFDNSDGAGGAEAEDNCGIDSLTYFDQVVYNPCEILITRTFVVKDSCGLTASCTQNITLQNLGGPVLTCPPGATVECYDDLITAIQTDSLNFFNSGITTTCDIPYQIDVVMPTPNACPGTYQIRYVVTDSCGRADSCIVDYTLDNSIGLLCRPDTTLECWSDLQAAVDRDSLAIVNGEGVTMPCGIGYQVDLIMPSANTCPDDYAVTFTITDSCGRTESCDRTYTIDNSIDLVCRADTTVECWSDLLDAVDRDSLAIINGEGVTMPCGISWTVDVTLPASTTCPGTYTVTYEILDSCGRTVSCDRNFTIDNSIDLVCRADTTVECWSDLLDAVDRDSLAIANGEGVTMPCGIDWTVDVTIPVSNTCPGTYTVTYEILDSCGRTVSCDRNFTIDNGIDLVCRADTTVECWSDLLDAVDRDSTAIAGGEGVTMPCGIDWTVEVELPAANTCPGDYTVTYMIEDSCGRRDTCQRLFTIDNSIALVCRADTTVECWSDLLDAVDRDSTAIAVGEGVTMPCGIDWTVEVELPAANTCPGAYTVTYMIEDSCGRRDTCERIYTVDNGIDLVCRADTTVECWSDLLDAVDRDSTAIADGEGVTMPCEINWIVEVELPSANTCPGDYTVTYMIEDSCGRRDTCQRIYTIDNAIDLVCRADTTVECWSDLIDAVVRDSSAIVGGEGVTMPCGIDWIVEVDLPSENTCPGDYTVSYMIEDSCGRRDTCERIFTIDNAIDLVCRADTTVECWSDLLDAVDRDTVALSNGEGVTMPCGINWTVEVELPSANTCPGDYTVTYMIEDSCGRRDTCQRIFTIDNAIDLVCRADTTVECWSDLLDAVDRDTIALSNGEGVTMPCGIDWTVEVELPSANTCPGDYTVTYMIEDSCGRRDTCQRIFTIDNAIDLVCRADTTVECWSDLLDAVDRDTTALSNGEGVTMPCGIDWTVEVELPSANTCPGDYTVTYMIEDSCGRRDTCQRIFTIANAIDLVCRADTTVECWSDLLEAVDRDTTALSNGEGVTMPCGIDWTVEVELPAANTCPGDYTVTYMIEDSCGRRDTCQRIFTIDNAIDLVCRADTTVECWSDLLDAVDRDSTAIAGGEGVTMPCGIDWIVEVDLPSANTCPGDYTVSYMIEDSCGRRDTCQRIFTIDNAIDLVCRADTTVECWSDLLDAADRDSTAIVGGEGVTMPCGIEWTVEVGLPSANTCPGDYTVTYMIEDSCGRRDTCQRIFTIDNAIDLVCRADTTIECWGDLLDAVNRDSAAIAGGEGVTMPCGIDWTVEVELPSANTCPGDYTVTYMIEDSCGRRDTCERIFTIDNAIDLVCRADTTVECWSDLLDAVDRDTVALSNGEGVTMPCGINWTVEVELPSANTCPGDYTVTYMIEDSCGRRDTCQRIFTIDNAIDLVCRADTTVECWSDLLDAVDRDTTALSNGEGVTMPCGIDWTVEVELPSANTCPGDYTVTYMIEDSCGRRDTCQRIFTIDNAIDLVCRADTTVECWSDLLDAVDRDSTAIASGEGVTMPCGIDWTVEVELPAANTCPGDYTVTYMIEDSCGRRDTCERIFTIDNAIDLVCRADTTVECWSDLLDAVDRDTTALSNGEGVTMPCGIDWMVEVELPSANTCPGDYTVTYMIEDSCGRRDTCERIFTIDNAIDLVCRADTTVECWSDILDAVDRDSTAIAGGEGVTMPCGIDWTVEVELPSANTCPGDYTVTYMIEDSCGRRDTCARIFTIDNVIDLVCRADTTVECWSDLLDAVDRDSTAIASGEGVTMPCGIDWTVEVELPAANTCPGDYTVTYMIEDSCGRRDTCERIFTIDNVIDLVCRADTTLECWSDLLNAVDRDSAAIAGGEGVTMPCGIDWIVEVDLPSPNTCPGTYTVSYMIEDSCGRRDTCERIFTLDNAIDLVCRADTTVECWSDLLDAVDRDTTALSNGEGVTMPCGIDWTVEVELPSANTCPGDYTVTYMIEDSCGRRDTCQRIFTIDNAIDLVCRADTTVECWSDLLDAVDRDTTALSNGDGVTMPCGIDWTVEVELPSANTCPGDYTVTYMIEDSCGRRDTCQRIFTIDNAIDLVCRADTTVECWSDLLDAVDRDTTALSNGDGVTMPCGIDWTVEVELPAANTCPGDYAVTYMIEDSCGRRDTCQRIFTIDNAIDLVCRADTTVECWSDLLDAVDRDNAIDWYAGQTRLWNAGIWSGRSRYNALSNVAYNAMWDRLDSRGGIASRKYMSWRLHGDLYDRGQLWQKRYLPENIHARQCDRSGLPGRYDSGMLE